MVVFRRGHCQPLQVGTGQWPLLQCCHGVVWSLGELVVERGRYVVLGGVLVGAVGSWVGIRVGGAGGLGLMGWWLAGAWGWCGWSGLVWEGDGGGLL